MQFSDKDWASILLFRSETPIKKFCYLAQIVVTPKDNKRTNVHVYDSTGTADNEIIHIGTGTGITVSVPYYRPFRIHNGIYVLFDGDTSCVQIIFKASFSESEIKD